uniref:Uncharacterized protein n=1 Tax=Echeneis naucrates TaxID=173247 RepID=A0A665U5Q4_ECHNA
MDVSRSPTAHYVVKMFCFSQPPTPEFLRSDDWMSVGPGWRASGVVTENLP